MFDTKEDDLTVIKIAMQNLNDIPCWVQVLDDASGIDPAVAITNDDNGITIPFTTSTLAQMEHEIESDRAENLDDLFRAVYVSFVGE